MIPVEYTDIAEYETLLVSNNIHRMRHSTHAKMIQSAPGQTVMLSTREGYFTFRIVESGQEIPVPNVASAIPKRSTLATKMQKTTGHGLTPKIAAAKRGRGRPKKAPPPPSKPDEVDDGEE